MEGGGNRETHVLCIGQLAVCCALARCKKSKQHRIVSAAIHTHNNHGKNRTAGGISLGLGDGLYRCFAGGGWCSDLVFEQSFGRPRVDDN